jgi:hypothetical protein
MKTYQEFINEGKAKYILTPKKELPIDTYNIGINSEDEDIIGINRKKVNLSRKEKRLEIQNLLKDVYKELLLNKVHNITPEMVSGISGIDIEKVKFNWNVMTQVNKLPLYNQYKKFQDKEEEIKKEEEEKIKNRLDDKEKIEVLKKVYKDLRLVFRRKDINPQKVFNNIPKLSDKVIETNLEFIYYNWESITEHKLNNISPKRVNFGYELTPDIISDIEKITAQEVYKKHKEKYVFYSDTFKNSPNKWLVIDPIGNIFLVGTFGDILKKFNQIFPTMKKGVIMNKNVTMNKNGWIIKKV